MGPLNQPQMPVGVPQGLPQAQQGIQTPPVPQAQGGLGGGADWLRNMISNLLGMNRVQQALRQAGGTPAPQAPVAQPLGDTYLRDAVAKQMAVQAAQKAAADQLAARKRPVAIIAAPRKGGKK